MNERDLLLEALEDLGPEDVALPSDRELHDYLAGQLEPETAEKIREIAANRPEVADRLLELAPFVEPEADLEPGSAEGSWRRLQDALEEPKAPLPAGLSSHRFTQPALAGLAALFFLTTVGLLLQDPGPPATYPAIANLRTLELVAGARGSELQLLELPTGEPFRVIIHSEIDAASCETFAVELTSLEGERLARVDDLRRERNRLELLLPAASGPTQLVLSGCGETLETFRVDIIPR